MPTLSGGCLCGEVRYEYTGDPPGLIYCHCKDCQRCTGGPFAAVALVRADAVKVVRGKPRSFTVTGEEGGRVFREFCGSCGSPLFSGVEANRKVIGLKVGSLDDASHVTPLMHIWTNSALPWLAIHDQLQRVPRNPPRPPRRSKEGASAPQKESEHA